ncbi:hypothetical protein ABZ608_39020 [Streptomyces sp. NPDC013172]|uniref:hypothetical protein n=1 Tax=Streptomyces sp. NPDC013172 TaxID=3155009 RepID=UPI0034018E74
MLGKIAPEEAWSVLRDVSQRTNIKVATGALHILDFAQGGDLSDSEQTELHQAITRYTRHPIP